MEYRPVRCTKMTVMLSVALTVDSNGFHAIAWAMKLTEKYGLEVGQPISPNVDTSPARDFGSLTGLLYGIT